MPQWDIDLKNGKTSDDYLEEYWIEQEKRRKASKEY